MLLSLARSSILKKCRLMAPTTVRAMSTALTEAGSASEFDTVGHSEAELDAQLRALDLPDGLAIITETDDSYIIKPTKDPAEVLTHLTDFAVQHEFTDNVDNKPYSEALGLDFSRKLYLTTFFGLTALSNEWYIMNDETIITAAFIGFVLSLKVFVGPMLVNWYEDYKEDFVREQNEAEAAHISSCRTVLDGFNAETINSSLDSMFDEEKAVIEAEAKARVIQEKNELISRYTKNLDKLVLTKNEASNKAYQQLLTNTVEAVRKDATKPAFKKKALQYALDAAMNKPVDENPTVALFDKVQKRLSK